MILMVLFLIKVVSVASVCVTLSTGTPKASTYSSCNDRSVYQDLKIYIDQGLTTGGVISYLSTHSYSNFKQCSAECVIVYDCNFFDYNCQTGNCIFYGVTDAMDSGSNNLYGENGHISGMYYYRAKK